MDVQSSLGGGGGNARIGDGGGVIAFTGDDSEGEMKGTLLVWPDGASGDGEG